MSKDLPAVSRRSLNKGQALLYELTQNKVKDNQLVSMKEAVEIYSDHVCRETLRGRPAGYVAKYDSVLERYTYELEELTQRELEQRSVQWMMNSLGSLVLRGYLKVIPQIRLED